MNEAHIHSCKSMPTPYKVIVHYHSREFQRHTTVVMSYTNVPNANIGLI